jgi:GT2 family glycosyltransferase
MSTTADHTQAVTRQPHVAAIVLNWNRPAETVACVESLLSSDWTMLTTIVVDNGSESNISDLLGERFPGVKIVRNETNRGFAGGMNDGIRHALEFEADYLLLLNNDTTVDPRMVRLLVEAARQHPDAGILSPLQFQRGAPDVVATAGLRVNPRHAYQGKPLRFGERERTPLTGVHEVDAVVGTAMLVPGRVLSQVGLLDERLYLYIEDVEWALRMRRRGYRIYVAYEARLWHSVSASSGGRNSPLVSYYHARNTFVVSARHAPMRRLRSKMREIEILAANLLHAWRCYPRLRHARAVLIGWKDYRRGKLGPAPPELRALAR